LLQDRDDLLFAVSRAFHCGSPLLGLGRTHILDGPVFGGWVTPVPLQADSFVNNARARVFRAVNDAFVFIV